MWLKSEFRGHLVHPQPATFCGFQASETPNETPRPPYLWSLGAAARQPGPRTVGAKGGSTGVPGAKKIPLWCLTIEQLQTYTTINNGASKGV